MASQQPIPHHEHMKPSLPRWSLKGTQVIQHFWKTWVPARTPVNQTPSIPTAQDDILLHLRATHHWSSFERFLQVFSAEQPQNLPVLQQAFGRTLQASWITSHLLNPQKHANQPMGDFEHLFFDASHLQRFFGPALHPMSLVRGAGGTVDLSNDVVITIPWKPDSTREQLRTLGSEVGNPFQASNNHKVESIQYFGVFWCGNGHHSSLAGILKREGEVPVSVTWDPTVLLQHVQVSADGRHYRKASTGEELGPVASQEFAAIFRIAQERLKLGLTGA